MWKGKGKMTGQRPFYNSFIHSFLLSSIYRVLLICLVLWEKHRRVSAAAGEREKGDWRTNSTNLRIKKGILIFFRKQKDGAKVVVYLNIWTVVFLDPNIMCWTLKILIFSERIIKFYVIFGYIKVDFSRMATTAAAVMIMWWWSSSVRLCSQRPADSIEWK